MLKRDITYTDWDGNEQTETFHFHLSKAELIEMEMSHQGGMEQYLQRIIRDKKGAEIMAAFKLILLSSVGKKSDDGRRFLKTEEIQQDFASSPAYDVIFSELCTKADAAAQFINGVIPVQINPNQLNLQADQLVGAGGNPGGSFTSSPAVATGEEPRILTRADLQSMSHSEVSHLLAIGAAVIGPDVAS